MASNQQRQTRRAAEIVRGLPDDPREWRAADLQRFAENIARAIESACAESAQESQQPEFGEEARAQ